MPRALSHRASQKPSRPASKATAMRLVLCPAFSASTRHRSSSFSNSFSSVSSFFKGWRSTPGSPRRRRRDVPRREYRIVGHTVASYDVTGEEKETAAYLRRVFAQRRIPDTAIVQLSAERVVSSEAAPGLPEAGRACRAPLRIRSRR